VKTKQLNVRVSEELLKDIDEIANELHIAKAEWIKLKLAEAVYETKKEYKRDKHAKK